MSSIKLSPNASGTGAFTIAAPNSNTDRTLTLPDATGTAVLDAATQTLTNKTLGSGLVMSVSAITAGTAVASTSGTSIDFTGIPSWVKRITVMFKSVSTNGSSVPLVQLGDSGGVEITGYAGAAWLANTNNANFTAGLAALGSSWAASYVRSGAFVLTNVGGNVWIGSGVSGREDAADCTICGGSKTLSDTLDRIRITTVNGTDTFDAGSINILYE